MALRTLPEEIARGHALRVGRERRQVLVPAVGQLAVLHLVELVGEVGILRPCTASSWANQASRSCLAAFADALLEVVVDAVGHEELGVFGPAVVPLGQADFVLAQRLAMGGAGVLLVGGAPADVAVDDDQGRPVVGLLRNIWKARSSRSRSLASPTRVTFQP